jgi:mono/diheme cytochrome c family protein
MLNPRTGAMCAAIALMAVGLSGLSAAQAPADAERGKILYETRCSACHASSVHNRDARKAKSYDGLRAQVLRWSAEAGRGWTADEIDAVALHLNRLYYHFPCPQQLCKADQALLVR